MAQFNWSYRTPTGQEYIVGLYHGTESGHLVVYCNGEIVAIDFNVLGPARYPFFIEEDLCEMRIERREDTFQYFFESNQEVDTPHNRIRKQRSKKNRLYLIALVVGIVLCAILLGLFIRHTQKREQQKAQKELLRDYGEETTARIYFRTDTRGGEWLVFSYAGGGQIQEGQTAVPPDRRMPKGMPLEEGDEFWVRYHPSVQEVSAIDLDRPTPEQIERYRQRALRKHLALHPELNEEQAACRLAIAFELNQVAGYADFFWQSAEPEQNPDHNRNSYLRLTRDTPYVIRVRERCP